MRPLSKRGFTLVELVIGIVVLAMAMLVMNTMLISQSKHALEPLYRLRASQLGKGVLQNILSRAYDQNADHSGGYYRCGEVWGDTNLWYDGTNWQTTGTPTKVKCTTTIGPESGEDEPPDFNDVDDFNSGSFESAVTYGDVLNADLSTQYSNYSIKVDVTTDSTILIGSTMKRIDVTVKTPSDEQIVFSVLKGNY